MAANKRAFTRELYAALLEHLRGHPGDIMGAAKRAGCHYQTARRTWHGPPRPIYPWARPIRDLLLDEDREQQRKRAEEDAAVRVKLDAEKEKAQQLAEEAKQWDETILRLARNDVMKGLASLGRLTDGLDALARRVNEQLKRGTDDKGNALDIPIGTVLTVMNKYAGGVARLADAAAALVAIERVKANLPTAIVALDISTISVEDAEREVALAQTAVARARHLGLTVVDGGKAGNG